MAPRFTFNLCLVLALVVLGSACVMAIKVDRKPGKMTLLTNTLSIVVEGNQNVPKFSFSFVNDTSKGFKVQFSKVVQTDSNHKDIGVTNIALASLSYDFTDYVTNGDDSVHFNITSTSNNNGKPTFQFRIHIDPNSKSFKFDTVISGVNWNNNAAHMQLCYKVLEKGSDNQVNNTNFTPTRASFGGGYFDIEPNALSGNGTVNVHLKNLDNSICVEYEKWDGILVHDPTLGYSIEPATSQSSFASDVKSFSALVMIIALIASFLL